MDVSCQWICLRKLVNVCFVAYRRIWHQRSSDWTCLKCVRSPKLRDHVEQIWFSFAGHCVEKGFMSETLSFLWKCTRGKVDSCWGKRGQNRDNLYLGFMLFLHLHQIFEHLCFISTKLHLTHCACQKTFIIYGLDSWKAGNITIEVWDFLLNSLPLCITAHSVHIFFIIFGWIILQSCVALKSNFSKLYHADCLWS